jgi:hypothetical protein
LPAVADVTNESIASPVCGFDKQWGPGIVVERVSQLTNCDFQDCIGNESFRPDGGEKIFFGDEMSGMLDELIEYGISLGPELDYFRSAPQTLVGPVQAKRLEDYAVVPAHTPVHWVILPESASILLTRKVGSKRYQTITASL